MSRKNEEDDMTLDSYLLYKPAKPKPPMNPFSSMPSRSQNQNDDESDTLNIKQSMKLRNFGQKKFRTSPSLSNSLLCDSGQK